MSPQRIQQKRTKGWRMPLNAKSVARPSRWGNPFRVDGSFGYDVAGRDYWFPAGHLDAVMWAVESFRDLLAADPAQAAGARRELAGYDLACWCPMGQLCHADVLLEIANSPVRHSCRHEDVVTIARIQDDFRIIECDNCPASWTEPKVPP